MKGDINRGKGDPIPDTQIVYLMDQLGNIALQLEWLDNENYVCTKKPLKFGQVPISWAIYLDLIISVDFVSL